MSYALAAPVAGLAQVYVSSLRLLAQILPLYEASSRRIVQHAGPWVNIMSDQADTLEVSGRVVRLEVENFKSYRGFQNIGPFKNFTAVVGPNGSGKSNLMDAISFVLGVKTAQLRGSLKELLYSNSAGNTAEDRPRKGLVKLVYESADGAETHFSRIIVPSSSSADATFQSQYKLNSKTVSWDGYNNQLKKYNILVKARNFLVFQVCI